MGHFRAKLFRFKMSEKAWGDMGVGMLRLMKHTTNDSRRMVLRNDMGKVRVSHAQVATSVLFCSRTARGPTSELSVFP